MSNVTNTPQPSAAASQVSPVDPEHLTLTGVRKVLEAYAEREVQRVRWSAVIAGLFLAAGTKILLILMGNAVGLTTAAVSAPAPLAGITVSGGVWTTLSVLVGFFVGGFAASKLSGSIRRGDGMLSGALTWSTTMVFAIWMAFPSAGAAAETAADSTSRAWFAFGCALLSLLAAMSGGAAGSVWGSVSRNAIRARRRESRRHEHELEAEKEQLRHHETEQRRQ
jgi:hypothetical protein